MLADIKLRPGEEGWYAVARADALSEAKMLRAWIFGLPIILYGSAAKPIAMFDRCPHRSAPLSKGRIVDGEVECPFHGWRFDGTGLCRSIPCLPGEPPVRKAHTLPAVVRFGIVFVRLGKGDSEPAAPIFDVGRAYRFLWTGLEVRGALGPVAENFLDSTHTITVHPGILRGTKPATPTKVIVEGRGSGVTVVYEGEGRPQGIAAKLFEGNRSSAVGRFRGPNITDVEFNGPRGLRLGITSYLTPTRNGKIGGFAVVTLPGPAWLGWLKFQAIRPFATLVNRQDMDILNAVAENHALFGSPPRASVPTDYIIAEIEAILEGKALDCRHEVPALL